MQLGRRQWLAAASAGSLAAFLDRAAGASPAPPAGAMREWRNLRVSAVRITPVALPDPPILYSGGAHGPYFLRNIIELETNAGITGIGETRGGEAVTRALEAARGWLVGANPFAYRRFPSLLGDAPNAVHAGLELACLDLVGRATGCRLCELLGGPVREEVEFCSYLFFRHAADHPRVLDDPQLCDDRGTGERALDDWGEVLTPGAMVRLARRFKERWGFRFHKLKAGVLPPDAEVETMRLMHAEFGGADPLRIDPNARWTVPTAIRVADSLRGVNLDYYEDPVAGQQAMAEVRQRTGLRMSTNMCITRVGHLAEAVATRPVDIVLLDHHSFGGMGACHAVAAFGSTLGWGFSQHSNNHAGVTMAAMISLGAVVPELTFASDTHYPWLPEGHDVIAGPNLPIRGGRMSVPAGPGLGVELDRARLEVAHDRYLRCGMRGRVDAQKMLRFDPGWKPPMY